MALVPSPQWLDTGDNAWQLAAATFVGLQSIPGLAVLYGGIVKKKWAINSAFMAIYAFASVLVVWVLFARVRCRLISACPVLPNTSPISLDKSLESSIDLLKQPSELQETFRGPVTKDGPAEIRRPVR